MTTDELVEKAIAQLDEIADQITSPFAASAFWGRIIDHADACKDGCDCAIEYD